MYIAVDIGGTKIKIASSPSLENPRFDKTIDIKTTNVYTNDLDNIIKGIYDLTTEKVEGIGLGIAGVLDVNKAELLIANNIKSWEHKPIVQDLQARFKCDAMLENDASCAAIGEALYGYGLNKDFLLITWGTGIGGAFVKNINGHIYTISTELGHQIIEWEGLADNCGQKGCLEAYCSGRGIRDLLLKNAEDLTDEEWVGIEKRFAHALMNIVAISGSALIIFSGSIALNQPVRLSNIERIIKNTLKVLPAPKLLLSKCEQNAGLYGALAIIKNNLHKEPSK